ncbi:hypothetical protein Sango_0357800 [Sesamum angolense]|uniref:Retrotransposon gag domain-containing protein n=1 Tax=Sesamum angolense TaxID=2727404 RepID=A0AAE1X9L6_9LAMI|nr:hypothetical protein Sango_0357800 [Sesamum angolense]
MTGIDTRHMRELLACVGKMTQGWCMAHDTLLCEVEERSGDGAGRLCGRGTCRPGVGSKHRQTNARIGEQAPVFEDVRQTVCTWYTDEDDSRQAGRWLAQNMPDVRANRERIETWEVLKKELKDQFLLCNTSWIARESLQNLKHIGMVHEFVKEFSSLMLDVRDMSKEDKLFNFMASLKPWAQTELRWRDIKDLPSAIAVAEGLGDFKVKIVNSKAAPVSGIANMELSVDSWSGQCNFVAVGLDDFNVILGGKKPTFGKGEYDGDTVAGKKSEEEMRRRWTKAQKISGAELETFTCDELLKHQQECAVRHSGDVRDGKRTSTCRLDSAAIDDGCRHKAYAGVGRWTVGLCLYHEMGLVHGTYTLFCEIEEWSGDGAGRLRSRGTCRPGIGRQTRALVSAMKATEADVTGWTQNVPDV